MSAAVRQRARIARVRRVQHVQAAGAVAAAEARVASLQGSATRLGDLRGLLLGGTEAASGMALANAHELASRLEAARHGLGDAIVAAQATAAERDRQRLAARIEQEGAEKLQARAVATLAAVAERRAGAAWRRRIAGEDE